MTTPDGSASRRPPDEQELARAAHASDALQQLLAAAAAPPSKAELKGRARAIAAFRAAYRLRRPSHAGALAALDRSGTDPSLRAENDPDARPGEERLTAAARRRAKLARARRWSAAQLTVAGAALLMLLGATAAAAAAGQLPGPLRQTVSDLFDGPAHPGGTFAPSTSPAVRPLPPVATRPAPAPTAPASTAPAPTAPQPRPTGSPTGPAGRSADTAARLAGLCRAYLAGGSRPARLSEPGFLPLVTAAGGLPGVEAYCATPPATGRAGSPPGSARRPQVTPSGTADRQPARSHRPPGQHPAAGSAPAHPPSKPPVPAATPAGRVRH